MSGDASDILIASNSSDCDCDLRTFTKSFMGSLRCGVVMSGARIQRGPADRHCSASGVQPSSSISIPSERISFTSTLKDSGMPACMAWSPSTMFLYILVRPSTSSDLTVSISCRV